MGSKEHWDDVYLNKNPDQVSWTQIKPETSLQLIKDSGVGKWARVIDVGGGDSRLVDYLLDDGFTNITVLDISSKAIEKAKKRLGNRADIVRWIVTDIVNFQPDDQYDLWHDRATFHFLTTAIDIDYYRELTFKYASDRLIIGTFSTNGPLKCSGLEVVQYDEEKLSGIFNDQFITTKCLTTVHVTPFNTTQNFQFCSFKKRLNITL